MLQVHATSTHSHHFDFIGVLQVEGVKWLWSVWTLNQGGILADDMGLGCDLVECTDSQVLAEQHARHPERPHQMHTPHTATSFRVE